jgi:starch phosphorylase
MKALRSFTVRTRLPEPLAPLGALAQNLRWAWDERTRDLFRWVDPRVWEETGHDPVGLLGRVRPERFRQLAGDPAFMSFLSEVHDELTRYLERPRWFQNQGPSPLRSIAYFSPEFGIAEALPQYSGGLGVLAGDHLKAASGLGVPLIGVGLFYKQGYFRQSLNTDGWQQETFPILDPFSMALTLLEGVKVTVELAGELLAAQVWRADVGRVRLYLLDSDVEDNSPDGRGVTDRLYGGGTEHRLRQEILLGIGGVRALAAIGEEAQVFHTNEGHAGFLGLERIRRFVNESGQGLSLDEAIEACRAGTVFTTHTPVPAGIDLFPRDLMEKYFSTWADVCGVTIDRLMKLGHAPGQDADQPFNMAVMGLRLAGRSNGVSKLHGAVSREMFSHLFPGVGPDETPIGSVTNGVHGFTWVSPEVNDLFTRYLVPGWPEADAEKWAEIENVGDDELWRVKEQGRSRLVEFVRTRLRNQALAKGLDADVSWCEEALDPRILTIGFARRFATYKRADLLLSQPERLEALLLSPEQPLQLVFAGKAHPADDNGKELIRRIAQFARRPEVRHRVAFVEDYDIAVARLLYQGSDVWLNNPRRPLEACGTSGEKAALNGALNLSILDGWWDEMYDGSNGWAIASAEGEHDTGRRDRFEAESLFDLLEQQVVPLFYDRGRGGPVPRAWVRRIKASLRVLGPQVEASRMVRDYVQQMYEPAAQRADAMAANGWERARSLAAWKRRVADAWEAVSVVTDDGDISTLEVGAARSVSAVVALGPLSTDDVAVQLVHGAVGPNDEIIDSQIIEMELVSTGGEDGHHRFVGTFTCQRTGRHGYTLRVVPKNPDLPVPSEMGCVAWGS